MDSFENGELIGTIVNCSIDEDYLDENGNIQYIYSLRYEEFIGLITLAVQKLWNKMEELKNEINSI